MVQLVARIKRIRRVVECNRAVRRSRGQVVLLQIYSCETAMTTFEAILPLKFTCNSRRLHILELAHGLPAKLALARFQFQTFPSMRELVSPEIVGRTALAFA